MEEKGMLWKRALKRALCFFIMLCLITTVCPQYYMATADKASELNGVIRLDEREFTGQGDVDGSYARVGQGTLGRELSLGGGGLKTDHGISVYVNQGHVSTASYDLIYDISDLDYMYFKTTVGLDDFTVINGKRHDCFYVSFEVLCDEKTLASTENLCMGEYRVLECNVPSTGRKLVLRTISRCIEGASGEGDWLDPMLCKSSANLYLKEVSEYSASESKTINSAGSFAEHIAPSIPFSAIKVHPESSQDDVTLRVYRYFYSYNRSLQSTPLYEAASAYDDKGDYIFRMPKVFEPGEYLLVFDGIDSIQYSETDTTRLFCDRNIVRGAANIHFVFSNVGAKYFVPVSDEPATRDIGNYATYSEQMRALKIYNGFLKDLTTFPTTVKIGETLYKGFNSDFTETGRAVTDDALSRKTTITLLHNSGLQFTLEATLYPAYAAFDYVINFTNTKDENSPVVSSLRSLDIDLEGENQFIATSYADTAVTTNYIPNNIYVEDGKNYYFTPASGRSTEDAYPYYNIEYGDKGMLAAIGWSGKWDASFTANGNVMNFNAGQATFESYLEPGENARIPLMAFVLYDGRDLDRATNLWRHWFIDCNMYRENDQLYEPFIAGCSSWIYHEMLAATEDNQIALIQGYKDKGIDIDYWWMDAGWYVIPGNDSVSPWLFTGNWEVDTERFPTKLAAISEFCAQHNINTLLWFEPERVGLYTTSHLSDENWVGKDTCVKKEWLMGYDINPSYCDNAGNYNLLDLGNKECLEWLIKTVSGILKTANIRIYREDFNIGPNAAFEITNTVENRKGISENKHIQGHYAYWDAILALDNIDMIDSCASGGHRNDLESMRRAVALHYSDSNYDDATARQAAVYTMAQWIPFFGCNTGSDLVNADKYLLRSCYRPEITLEYNVNNDAFNATDVRVLQRAIEEWKEIKGYFYSDIYLLTDWNISADRWLSYEYFDDTSGNGYAMVFRRNGKNAPSKKTLKLKGLVKDATYRIDFADSVTSITATGEELMNVGVEVKLANANKSEIVYITQRKAGNTVYGDLDNDRKVTAADALIALQKAVRMISFNYDQNLKGDVDKNTGISSSDALMILSKAVGKIDQFPVEQ